MTQYKDTKVARNSELYKLLQEGKNDKAETLYKQVCAAFDRAWDPKYNYLRNWNVSGS
jgi:hypothetical protein